MKSEDLVAEFNIRTLLFLPIRFSSSDFRLKLRLRSQRARDVHGLHAPPSYSLLFEFFFKKTNLILCLFLRAFQFITLHPLNKYNLSFFYCWATPYSVIHIEVS